MSTSETTAVGLDPNRWKFALKLARDWCERDVIPAIGLLAGRLGRTMPPQFFGRRSLSEGSSPLTDDAIFLVASLTKPLVATGVLMLVERGEFTLGDRVCDIVPEFGTKTKYGITVRNLLTHTSGLPDMLPENLELRRAGAPLSEFVKGTCAVQTDFPPGRAVQYQSMGFLMLGEIIARVSGKSCADFLRDEIFLPLNMQDTALGAPPSWFEGSRPRIERIAEIRIPEEQRDAADWGWNSRYWRSLGAPWGGLLTTPADLGKFAQMMLGRGAVGPLRLLSSATVEAATTNQLLRMQTVPEEERRCRPWGLGWRLQWPEHSSHFGDLLGPRVFGHWGATGTLFWIDPERDAFAVILSTEPQEPHGKYLARLSNAVAASFL